MKSILLTVIVLFFSNAWAAPRVNSGGGGWKCWDKNGTRWIRSVDLFEAEYRHIPLSKDEGLRATEILTLKLQKISAELPQLKILLDRYPVNLETAILEVPELRDPTDDAYLIARPPPATCAGGKIGYVQIATYLMDGTILLSSSLWNDRAFSEQEKAAILLHEILYKAVRDEFKDENSLRARYLVGLVFSSFETETLSAKVTAKLALPTQRDGDDIIPPFPVKTTCYAGVENMTTNKNIATKHWTAENFGDSSSFELEGFLFTISTSPIDGLPWTLSILEKENQVETSLDVEDMMYSLIKTKSANLKLRRKSPTDVTAKLYCFVEDKN